MGDRGNIFIAGSYPQDDNEKGVQGVYLYSHWGGSELPKILAMGLNRGRDRWGDEQYLARIIFQTMIGDDTQTTGYGISAVIGDNSYPILVVCDEVVYKVAEGKERDRKAWKDGTSFEDWVLRYLPTPVAQ